jgi:hypothetical protein
MGGILQDEVAQRLLLPPWALVKRLRLPRQGANDGKALVVVDLAELNHTPTLRSVTGGSPNDHRAVAATLKAHQGAGSRTCARRTNSLDALLSTGDFQGAHRSLGKDAPNLSLVDHCTTTRVAAGEHRLDAAVGDDVAIWAGGSHEVHRIVEAIRRTRRSAGSDHQPRHIDGCRDHQNAMRVYPIGQIVVAEWTHSSLHR